MSTVSIEKQITIDVTPDKVWRVFTQPALTQQLGGEYLTEWSIGSPFGWKGLHEKINTIGTILQLEPTKLLQHNLVNAEDRIEKSIITYRFESRYGSTTLTVREDFKYDMTDTELEEANAGWDNALMAIKDAAESI